MQKAPVILTVLAVVLGATLGPWTSAPAQELSTAGPLLADLAKLARDPAQPQAERIEAIATLGRWGTAQVLPDLLAVLEDPAPPIRVQAARALGWEGNSAALPGLVAHLSAPIETPAVRAAAASALSTIGDAAAREPLLSHLQDREATVRLAVMQGLAFGPLKSAVDTVPVMIALLADNQQPRPARGEAARALGDAKDARAFDVLLKTLEHGPPGDLVPFTYQPKNQGEVFQARVRGLGDIRAWSAQALGQLGDPRAAPALKAASADPDDYLLRLRSVEALVRLKEPTAAPVFLKALSDPFPPVRFAGVVGVRILKVDAAVEPLLTLLGEKDFQVRQWAAATLGDLGDARARDALTLLSTTDPNPEVRKAAEEALPKLAPAK